MSLLGRIGRVAALLSLAPLALAACGGDGSGPGPGPQAEIVSVVLNSVDRSLTVAPSAGAATTPVTIGLGQQGTPVGFAVRLQRVAVPMGTYPFVAVVNLAQQNVERFIPLPANSGATGAAFIDNFTVIVANPGRNSVTPVDVAAGVTGAEVPVGVYPQAVVFHDNRIYVVNANLVNFTPAGPGSVTVLNSQLNPLRTIALTGRNPATAVALGNRLYVLNSGDFGQNNGSLSVVNLATQQEEQRVNGFGEFPGSLAAGPDGNLYVGVYGTGILVWNPSTGQFVRGLNNPIVPGGSPPVSALAFDPSGNLHTANPGGCQTAGSAYRLNSAFAVERTITTGVCPFYIGFGVAPVAQPT